MAAFHRIGETGGVDDIKGFGYGEPLLVRFEHGGRSEQWVLSTVAPGRHGHEHMADRAQVILWSHDAFNRLPHHARALDVGAFTTTGDLRSLADVQELFLAVEFVEGTDYHQDLEKLRNQEAASDLDRARIDALCDYLVEIHSLRGPDPGSYNRRIRELLGHGECVMGVVDSYPLPSGFLTAELLESTEHEILRWCWKLRGNAHRVRQVHGDYHPWNVMFQEGASLRVLDRSRGEWGEPADDLTCLTMNLLFYSLQEYGALAGAYEELWTRCWARYLAGTGDDEILAVCAPFFAFRGLVMASPLWYPSLDETVRRQLFAFLGAVMRADRFDPGDVAGYLR